MCYILKLMIFTKEKMKVAIYQFDEILQKINDSPDVESELRTVIDQPYIRGYLNTQLSEVWPEFDVDKLVWKRYKYHRSLAGASLLTRSTFNMFMSVLMNPQSKRHTQEFRCKSLLEMLYEAEADILVALLKKNLQSLYPNITHEVLNKVL